MPSGVYLFRPHLDNSYRVINRIDGTDTAAEQGSERPEIAGERRIERATTSVRSRSFVASLLNFPSLYLPTFLFHLNMFAACNWNAPET